MSESGIKGTGLYVRHMVNTDYPDGWISISGDKHFKGHMTLAGKGKFVADAAATPGGPPILDAVIDSRRGKSWVRVDKDLYHNIRQVPNDPIVSPEMLAAACVVAPDVDRNTVLAIIGASQVADKSGHLMCVYANRVPMMFEERLGRNAEFDALFKRMAEIAAEEFGDLVDDYEGFAASVR